MSIGLQRRVSLGAGRVLKTILMKARQHCLLFGFRQSPMREPQPGRRLGRKTEYFGPLNATRIQATSTHGRWARRGEPSFHLHA
jgi:hypothetical protein